MTSKEIVDAVTSYVRDENAKYAPYQSMNFLVM